MLRTVTSSAPVVLSVALAACSGDRAAPRQEPAGASGITAEIHVHQYPGGSHLTAGFLERPVPFRPELDEQLVHFHDTYAAREGECALTVSSRCTPTCDGDREFCALGGTCTPYEQLRFLDGGPVVVRGAPFADPIRLTYDAAGAYYVSDRPSTEPVFIGGETLRVEVPGGPWALTTEIEAPIPAAPTSPVAPLHVAADAPLRVEWPIARGSVMVRLHASNKLGEWANVACTGEDRGFAEIPRALIARLPAAPRDLTLELIRFHRKLLPLPRPGEQAAVIVAATSLLQGWD